MGRLALFSRLLLIILLATGTSFPSNSAAFFGAKLDPPDGKIYHGAQAEVRPLSLFSLDVDWKGIDEYSKTCGHRPKLIMHYISFDPVAFCLLRSTIFKISTQPFNYIPQIGLDFYSYIPNLNIMNPTDITHRIARGDLDHYIKRLAEFFVNTKAPVFLRPGYEFGGNGRGRLASEVYWVDAWKRIFNIFEREGVNSVAFVWNTLDEQNYMKYYPGDKYVDWWAINVFSSDPIESAFINSFIVDAARHEKPVMVAESTPKDIGYWIRTREGFMAEMV